VDVLIGEVVDVVEELTVVLELFSVPFVVVLSADVLDDVVPIGDVVDIVDEPTVEFDSLSAPFVLVDCVDNGVDETGLVMFDIVLTVVNIKKNIENHLIYKCQLNWRTRKTMQNNNRVA